MTADREALKRDLQDAIEGNSERVWEYLTPALVLAELEAAETVASQRLKRWNDCSDAYRTLEAERDQWKTLAGQMMQHRDELLAERDRLREALEAVAESKFATEPHRIARDALGEEASA